MKKAMLFATIVAVFAGFGCKKEKDYAKIDRDLITADLAKKGLAASEQLSSGIFYIIDKPGNDQRPDINSLIEFTYKGTLLDGTQFDASDPGKTAKYSLYELIEGWQKCIPLLGKGGHGTFWIPSDLAYGSQELPGIPAHSPLIFEITLVDFQ